MLVPCMVRIVLRRCLWTNLEQDLGLLRTSHVESELVLEQVLRSTLGLVLLWHIVVGHEEQSGVVE
jgi:hypothetical protein